MVPLAIAFVVGTGVEVSHASGATTVAKIHVVREAYKSTGDSSTAYDARCPRGEGAVGGGASAIVGEPWLEDSRPLGAHPPNAWRVRYGNTGGGDPITVYVIRMAT